MKISLRYPTAGACALAACLLALPVSAQITLSTAFEYGGTTGSGSALADGLTYRVSGGAGTSWEAGPLADLTAQGGATFLYVTSTSVRNFSTLFSSALSGSETSATLELNLGFGTGTTFGSDLFNVVLFADVNGDNFYNSGGTEDIATVGLADFTAPTTAGTFPSVVLSFDSIDTSSYAGKNLGFFISAKTSGAGESFAVDGPVTLTTDDSIFVIPEPSIFALLSGFIAIGCVLRRRRA